MASSPGFTTKMVISGLIFVGMDGQIGHDEYDDDNDGNENHDDGDDDENDVLES